jgi:hypothetical protein
VTFFVRYLLILSAFHHYDTYFGNSPKIGIGITTSGVILQFSELRIQVNNHNVSYPNDKISGTNLVVRLIMIYANVYTKK